MKTYSEFANMPSDWVYSKLFTCAFTTKLKEEEMNEQEERRYKHLREKFIYSEAIYIQPRMMINPYVKKVLVWNTNFFLSISPVILQIVRKDPYTLFYITDLKGNIAIGQSICSTQDDFDIEEGVKFALDRARKAYHAKMNLGLVRKDIWEFKKDCTIGQIDRVINSPFPHHCTYIKG